MYAIGLVVRNILNKIKSQPIDSWFFFLFLATCTLSVRKVVVGIPIGGIFNEYMNAYLYLSDIFFLLALFSWTFSIICHKISSMSMGNGGFLGVIHRMSCAKGVDNSNTVGLSTGKYANSKAFFNKLLYISLSKTERAVLVDQFLKKCSTWNILVEWSLFTIPLLIVVWSFISFFWSENRMVSIYRSVKFLELYLLYIYVAFRFCPRWLSFLKNCFIFPVSSLGESILRINNVEIVPRGTISIKTSGDDMNMFHVEQYGNILLIMARYFRAILLGCLLIALFDHYLWDIWQGQVLLWLIFGVLAGISFGTRDELMDCSTWNNPEANDIRIVPRGTISAEGFFCWTIMSLGVVHSLVGIIQFVKQHSLGLFWLRESFLSPDVAGVAKLIANYHPVIRAYGLFPHSNILGGFLLFSIMMTLLYLELFHVEQSKKKNDVNCTTWNNFGVNICKIVPRGTILNYLIRLVLLIQIVGIVLSFSKSAILALVVALVYLNFSSYESVNKRGVFLRRWFNTLFHVEQFSVLFMMVFVSLIVSFFLRVEICSLFARSIEERVLYLSLSERIIAGSPIIGVGTGQFISTIVSVFPNLAIWQYQPVHNVFLLIWSELGVVGLVFFILFLWKLFHLSDWRERVGKLKT